MRREIDFKFVDENAESSRNCKLRGISIDWNEKQQNAFDSIRFGLEFDPNEIAKRDLHDEKHDENGMWITLKTETLSSDR
jgi:hypothetical protein